MRCRRALLAVQEQLAWLRNGCTWPSQLSKCLPAFQHPHCLAHGLSSQAPDGAAPLPCCPTLCCPTPLLPLQVFEFQPDPGLQTIQFERPDLVEAVRELGELLHCIMGCFFRCCCCCSSYCTVHDSERPDLVEAVRELGEHLLLLFQLLHTPQRVARLVEAVRELGELLHWGLMPPSCRLNAAA